ncbi:cell division protein FtsK [Fervidicella metallireducens AeB]|uniref:Cell division protein FtsK n=2 Tax=Fervidicella TaxID=1403538 RepID=A0A017RUU8_9CLOT|nr:cell division protein FtsK [Fervidicella metallireducens AeB]
MPLLVILVGLANVINKGRLKIRQRFIALCVLFYNILLIIHISFSYKFKNLEIIDRLKQSFEYGLHSEGGGVISEIVMIPLIKVFDKAGTYIILVCSSLIMMILITEISLGELLNKFITDIKQKIKKDKVNRKSNAQESVPQIILQESELKKNYENNIETIDKKIKILDFIKPEHIEVNDESDKIQTKNVAHDKNINHLDEISIEITQKTSTEKENRYIFPSLELLNQNNFQSNSHDKKELLSNAKILEETLQSFGVDAKVVQVSRGPAVTRYELQPSPGVKVSKIVNLSDDIALNLAAPSVRIEAPIPGKAAVGIEVPNKEVVPVTLREVIESPEFIEFNSKVAFALGKDIGGKCVVADIAKMPHLLIAGATGSGKSVCINTLIASLIYKSSPKEVKMLMIDPKVVELSVYNGIPHLLIPVVTEPKKAASALYWAVNEMTQRYKLFAENNVRNIESYNKLLENQGNDNKLPQIVIIIDELADLMMVAPNDVEDAICRLAQMARAAGMHLVIATQRPSVDVITGVIKANIPSRISFAVSSQIDSRTILDMAGAEKLLGKGDMLFFPIGENKPIRIQGAFISEKEVEKIVESLKQTDNTHYDTEIINEIENKNEILNEGNTVDELLSEAIKIAVDLGQVSASMLQRRLRIGFNRAARLVEEMELRGIVSQQEGSKPRQVLISKEDLENN